MTMAARVGDEFEATEEDLQLEDENFKEFDVTYSMDNEIANRARQQEARDDRRQTQGGNPRASPATVHSEDIGVNQGGNTRWYTDLFTGKKRFENGVTVPFIPPASREILEFTCEDVVESVDYWKFALIGTVLGQKLPYEAIKRYTDSRWTVTPSIHVVQHGGFCFPF
ncbi:hypothetical protein OROGR_015852 [Orobanche gracilis]